MECDRIGKRDIFYFDERGKWRTGGAESAVGEVGQRARGHGPWGMTKDEIQEIYNEIVKGQDKSYPTERQKRYG